MTWTTAPLDDRNSDCKVPGTSLTPHYRPCLCFLAFFYSFSLLISPLVLFSPAQARNLRVGYDPGYGIIELTKDNYYEGYSYQYLQSIAQYTGWTYDFVACDWGQCLNLLAKGELDILPGMQRSASREKIYDFALQREGFVRASLVTLTSRQDIFYEDPEGYRGLRVIMPRNSGLNLLFEAYANQHGLQVERVMVDSVAEVLPALKKGLADMAIISTPMDVTGLKEVANLGPQSFHLGVSHKATGVLDELNRAQWMLEREDGYVSARLHERYFAGLNAPQALSRKEEAFATKSPPLRVAINPAWWPLESYNDPRTSQPTGITCDLLQLLSALMNIPLTYVQTNSYAHSLELMRRGEVDIITGPVGTMETHLGNAARVSRPLLRMPLVLVGRQGAEPGPDAQIGVPRYFQDIRGLAGPSLNERGIPYESMEEIAKDLVQGRLNLAVMSSWRYDNVANLPGFSNLRVLGVLTRDASVALGVSSHVAPELLSLINKTLLRITSDDVERAVFSHTVGKSPSSYWLLMWRAYGAWLALGFVLLLLLGVSLALYSKVRSARRLRQVALTDELTGMGNYKAFVLRGKSLQRRGNRILVSMDINNFKNFNAYYGHQAGNVVLEHTAQILRYMVREGELACRTGGDEFAMLLEWPGSLEAAYARLEPLETELATLANPEGQQRLKLTYSFGVYRLPSVGISLQAALDCAGEARKAAKEVYKTTMGVYDAAMDKRITEERIFEEEMMGAHARGEFVVRLQPKCDLGTGDLVGAEALVRWEHPQRGEIMPAAFINLFERNGFIARLDMFVLDCVCAMLRRWIDECRPLLPISVNMSRLHVLDANFVGSVKKVIGHHGIPPQLLELEVTESAFLENTDLLLHIMDELREFGVSFSMDDFGTGYSSLNMLKSIPVSVLKLDKAFLSSLSDASTRGRDIVRHVVSMAQSLNMDVVCEGVETAAQVDFLRGIGCHVGQGFFYARPMSIMAFEHMAFGEPATGGVIADVASAGGTLLG